MRMQSVNALFTVQYEYTNTVVLYILLSIVLHVCWYCVFVTYGAGG